MSGEVLYFWRRQECSRVLRDSSIVHSLWSEFLAQEKVLQFSRFFCVCHRNCAKSIPIPHSLNAHICGIVCHYGN